MTEGRYDNHGDHIGHAGIDMPAVLVSTGSAHRLPSDDGFTVRAGYLPSMLKPQLMRLEERIVLDGACATDCFTGQPDNDNVIEPGGVHHSQPESGHEVQQLDQPEHVLIISSHLDGAEQLAAAALDDVLPIVHNPQNQTLAELAAMLQGKLQNDRVESIAIASHGTTGGDGFMIGDQVMNLDSLDLPQMQAFWQALASMVQPEGRIDVLACDTTSTPDGQALIDTLEASTGIDFAASDDTTGHETESGDWILETDGIDAAAIYFNLPILDQLSGVMANTPASISYPSDQQTVIAGGSIAFAGATLISITDPDSNPTVTLSSNHGVISLSQTSGLSFSVGDGTNDASMTFSGSVTNINAALDGLDVDFSGVPAFSNLATLSIQADDGAGPADHAAVPILVGGGANTAPVLGAGIYNMDTIDEDQSPNTGTLISDVIASVGGNPITDADALAGEELEGIAVTDLNGEIYGTWQFSLDSGTTWTDIGAVAANNALLLAALPDARIRFVPDAHHNDVTMQFPNNPYFQFRAWDQSAGVNGSYVNATVTGGNTPYSAAQRGAQISVTQLNDAPTVSMPGDQQTNTQNNSIILPAITIDDADDFEDGTDGNLQIEVTLSVTDGNAAVTLASIANLTNLSGNGTSSISFQAALDDANAALNGLTFDADDSWFGTDSLSVTVDDLGNTGNGGAQSVTDSTQVQVDDVTPTVPTDTGSPGQDDDTSEEQDWPEPPLPIEPWESPIGDDFGKTEVDLNEIFGEESIADISVDHAAVHEGAKDSSVPTTTVGHHYDEDELDKWMLTGIDEQTALHITRELVLNQELLFDEAQAEEIREAYNQIILLYAHSSEQIATHLLWAFKAVVESASTYKSAMTVIEAAQREIVLATDTNMPVIGKLKLLLSDAKSNQLDVREATENLETSVVAAAQAGEKLFDRFAEDAITAALYRLNTENEELILAFRSLDVTTRLAYDIRVHGPIDNAALIAQQTIQEARDHAQQEITRIREQWDQAAEDLLAACLKILVSNRENGK